METVFVLANQSGDINLMINNISETLAVCVSFDDAIKASQQEIYNEFDLAIEELRVGDINPDTNILHCWERSHTVYDKEAVIDPVTGFSQLF